MAVICRSQHLLKENATAESASPPLPKLRRKPQEDTPLSETHHGPGRGWRRWKLAGRGRARLFKAQIHSVHTGHAAAPHCCGEDLRTKLLCFCPSSSCSGRGHALRGCSSSGKAHAKPSPSPSAWGVGGTSPDLPHDFSVTGSCAASSRASVLTKHKHLPWGKV